MRLQLTPSACQREILSLNLACKFKIVGADLLSFCLPEAVLRTQGLDIRQPSWSTCDALTITVYTPLMPAYQVAWHCMYQT